MTLSGLAFLWLVIAVGCVLVGTLLTRRRLVESAQVKRPVRRTSHLRGGSGVSRAALCPRCAQPLEVDARFCGACGLYLGHKEESKRTWQRIAGQR